MKNQRRESSEQAGEAWVAFDSPDRSHILYFHSNLTRGIYQKRETEFHDCGFIW